MAPSVTRILYTHSAVRQDCQVEPAKSIARLRARGWAIDDRYVEGDHGYWMALARGWGVSKLINVEQDIVVEESQARGLDGCRADACAIPYRLKTGEWSVYEVTPDDNGAGIINYYQTPGAWAGGSGLGLVKLSPKAQRAIPLNLYPYMELSWWGLDVWISREMMRRGIRWHVHNDTARHIRPNLD